VSLLERVLPRHLQIIYEINRRLLETVAVRWPDDSDRQQRMSLIEEGETKQVRMANLAITGSHAVNGVAAVHSKLVQTKLVPDFYQLWPERFQNKTNGITPRRWLLLCNRGLAGLISDAIGENWITDLDQLRRLEPFTDDTSFRECFLAVKSGNKQHLARVIADECGVAMPSDALFDVQVKRIHEYKRQLLNVLHIVDEYLALVEDKHTPEQPRAYVFAGKAAPGYFAAKQIIRLINDLAQVINHDPRSRDWMKVAYVPDYRVSLAEIIIPAADLSEQISTAGTEASGTSNMKFALNGALTMATLDGANIEIREAVGAENIFIFGLTVEQILQLRATGYQPREIYLSNPRVQRVLRSFKENRFCPRAPGRHEWVYQKLLADGEPYCHLADLESYLKTQHDADLLYRDHHSWARKAILNVARMGRFSSDRTIREYANDIWGIKPVR
jgi:starch phosphorylase